MNMHMFYVLVACLYNYGMHGHFGLTTVKQRVVWRAWYCFGSGIYTIIVLGTKMKELAQSWYGKGGSTTYGSNLVEVGVGGRGSNSCPLIIISDSLTILQSKWPEQYNYI